MDERGILRLQSVDESDADWGLSFAFVIRLSEGPPQRKVETIKAVKW